MLTFSIFSNEIGLLKFMYPGEINLQFFGLYLVLNLFLGFLAYISLILKSGSTSELSDYF